MTDDDGDGIYEVTIEVSGPAEIQYKFTNGDPFPDGEIDVTVEEDYDFSIGLCGAPNGIGGFNRIHQRSGSPEDLDVVCYNSCVDCGQNVGETEDALELSLYPNPAGEVLNFSTGKGSGIVEMQVVDLQGRVVMARSFNVFPGSVQQIGVSSLPKGMYLLQVTQNGTLTTERFLRN